MWELTRNCLSYLCHLYRQAFDPTHPSICATFIFGTALQNFGTRTDSVLERPAWFAQSKYVQHFSMLILNGAPETRTTLLNLWVPALLWQRFTYDFRRTFVIRKKMAHSRVQKAISCLIVLKKRRRLSQMRDEISLSLEPLLHGWIKAANVWPAASYFEFWKSTTFKRGLGAS